MVLGLAEDRFLCNRAIQRKVFQNCFRLNLLCRSSSLFAAVRFFNVPRVQDAENQYLANHVPLHQSGRAFHRNTDTVHYRQIIYLTAGNQSTFLARNILTRYSAIQIAVALADAIGCGVNDLPLSWYEQKAVCILLTLLNLGIKNIC